MNCQAFRKAWLEDTDSDVFSHIETCEDCIAWIEKQMTTDEEVQFLKEVPLPQANLEERIMQAIYESAEKGTPPHAAAQSLEPPTPLSSKRRTKGFPSFAWVSAAAVLLAVGFVGYQQLQSNDLQQVAGQAQDIATGASAPSEPFALNRATESNEAADAPALSPKASTYQGTPAAGSTEQSQSQQQAAATSGPAAQPKAPTTEAPATNARTEIAINTQTQPRSATPPARSAVTESHPSARNASANAPVAVTGQKAATNAPAAAAKAKADSAPANEDAKAAAAADNDQPVYALTSQALTDTTPEAEAKAFVGPPVQKAAITLSTFSDTQTAVQASDMPVPILAQPASGFSVSDISVQYESETSQKVTRLTADYKRNQSWIKIDVVRNTHGKRSLSIPGTFTATQLFTVGGEQAIGVSFDQKGTKESTVEHAVHFNAQPDNQSLYVVITAHGIGLDELIEATKQITWE